MSSVVVACASTNFFIHTFFQLSKLIEDFDRTVKKSQQKFKKILSVPLKKNIVFAFGCKIVPFVICKNVKLQYKTETYILKDIF